MISSHCDFLKSAKFEDEIIIKTWIIDKPRSTLKIDYEVFLNHSSDLLAKGYTVHAFLGRNGRAQKPPREILLSLNN